MANDITIQLTLSRCRSPARRPLRCLALASLLMIAVRVAVAAVAASSGREQPNVLMIAIDDMNDWVNCLHSYRGVVHTPNLDRLAARGRLFMNAHSVVSLCGPSRNAVMSMLRPSTTGCYDNGTPLYYNHPEIVCLPRYFRDHGYYVAGIGKLFHQSAGMNDPTAWAKYPNFDYRYDLAWLPPQAPVNGIDHGKHKMYPTLDWGPLEEGSRAMHDSPSVDWSVTFLSRHHTKPFFLATGILMPHIPWFAPKQYFELYPLDSTVLPPIKADDLDDVPSAAHKGMGPQDLNTIQQLHKLPEVIQAYLASISYVDALVGRLLDALAASEYSGNTVIVLWSDHGFHFGENHFHKFTLWERATRVPFIIAGPGVAQPGATTSRPVSLLDIYPTLIDLCGLPAKTGLGGVSLMPQLKDPAAPRREPALMELRPGDFAVRTQRWRYIRYLAGEEELYDHDSDPNEWTNLAESPQHRQLRADLVKWIPARVTPPAPISMRTHTYDAVACRWDPKASGH